MNKTAYIAAGNQSTSREELAQLALSPETKVRVRVAENPMCPTIALAALAEDANPEVRCTVAGNPKATFNMIRLLAKDFCLNVRYTLAEDPNLPKPILKMLSRDENPYVSSRAAQTLDRIKCDQSAKRRSNVLKHSHA